MKIHSINNQGGNISFRSGYPTFQSAGHLSYSDDKAPVHENTKPFYRQMSTKEGDKISFRGVPPYRHHADDTKCPLEGCQPIKPQAKVPPKGGMLIYRHFDTLGNVLDIKA